MIGGKKIALNTLLLTLASLINVAISIVTTSIIARNIGPELYGRYTFGLTFILMFSVLANFGLESLYIREAARDRGNLVLIGDIFHLKIILAIGTIISIIFAAHVLNYPQATITVLYILCAGLFFQILSESLLSVYRTVEKMHVTALFSTLFRIFGAIVVIISVYAGIGFYGIVAAFSIGNALVFAGVLGLFLRQFRLLNLQFSPAKWVPLVRQGMPFYLSALLTMFYAKINIIILSKFVSDREIGFYMAALNLVENLYFIPTAFVTSAFPAFSRLYGSSEDALRTAYIKVTKYLIILTVAVAMGTILVSEKIVLLIYGSEFSPAVPVLNILIFLWVFAFFSNVQSSLLFSIHKEKAQVRIMAFAVLANAVLNYIFIRSYGYMGAAVASVLTEGIVVALVSAVLWQSRFRYVPDMRILRLALVVGGMMLMVQFLLQFNLVVAITGGAVVYAALLFILGVFDADDIVYMKSVMKRRASNE
jgi:O-antigen/teichoic acid export membrane protein